MKSALLSIVIILGLATSACTVVPAGIASPGTQGSIVQLGGRMKLTTPAATLEIDNVESFKDGSRLIDNGIKAWGIVRSLDRYLESEDATTATNAATRGKELDSANEAARIASEERLAAQAMELEAEAAATAIPTQ